MRSIKLNKKVKLNKLPDIDALSINSQPKSRNIISYNKVDYNTFSSEKEISKIISSSFKNENNNISIKKKTRNCNSNSNIEDNTIYSMTNLKFFKRKNFSISEAKNILKSDSVRAKEFVNVLFLDNWAQKHYQSPKSVKQYIPKLKIKNKSFNINT